MALPRNKLLLFYFIIQIICSESFEIELPLPLIGLENSFEEILGSGPNLLDDISKLENTDFLEKYKEASHNEDKYLNITQLATKYGYKLHMYPLVTEDGYKIMAYRIPGTGDPVLLVHGVLNNAVEWFTLGWDNALPYVLADEGYDVWLVDCRGSTEEARGHVSLDAEIDEAKYWDFSWDEIGQFDIPATIDLVLKETGKEKLKYVGFSQGTTSFYVMNSMRPEYNSKISLMVSLSPVAWMSHIKSPLLKLISPPGVALAKVIRNVIGANKVEVTNPLVKLLANYICGDALAATIVCGNLNFLISGFDYQQLNVTQLPVIFANLGSISFKQLLHYGQEIISGHFRRYDYGLFENIARYGTADPPNYPVEEITAPVALFYRTGSDWLSSEKDVAILYSKLPNVVDVYEVPFDGWCHTDYIWGKDAKKFVYNRVVDLFKKY